MSSIERMVEKLKASASPGEKRADLLNAPSAEKPELPGEAMPRKQKAGRYINVDMAKLEQLGFIAPQKDRVKLSEEYRQIKRPLLANAFGKGAAMIDLANLIMLTSALPGEGKTFTAINLAMSLANEMDHTVLVVDIDVINPATTALFGLQDEPGLTDILSNPEVSVEDVLVGTNLPKLKIMPAGQYHSHANELLASEQMKRLAYELSTRYADRIVILDAPPLLITNEANVVSGLVGQVLMVVEAGKTSQNAVKDAVTLLAQNDDHVVGLVLNKSRRSNSGQYGAYYGEYGEEQE